YALSSSSSQFFMKMPTTSWPCCLSRYAVTAESTPPLKPTTMRCLVMPDGLSPSPDTGSCRRSYRRSRQVDRNRHSGGAGAGAQIRVQQFEREPCTGNVVFDTAQHNRGPVPGTAGADLVDIHPQDP